MLLPHKFKPRAYQLEIINVFMTTDCKRFIDIWHRRAGKDRTWFNILIGAACARVGMYVYTFPTLTQARKVIWEGRGKDGIKFLDQIPKELIKGTPNNSDMKVELKNGSIIRLGGTDKYDAWVGSNVLGAVFSEYSVQNPLAWDLIRPILAENNGWAAFIYTPRSRNHGYDLYKQNKDNKSWHISLLTVNDTKDTEGNPIISPEVIEEEAKSGMSEDLIEQEYYCSFDAALRGAIFGLQLAKMREEKRICLFPIESDNPVYTFWDLGYGDSTAIWLAQKDKENDYWNLIYYYENQGQALQHYVNVLIDIRNSLNIVYRNNFYPHDALKHELSTGLTIADHLAKLGFPGEIVPRIPLKEQAIELGRGLLNRVRIHEQNCGHGLECLKSYCKVWHESLGIFSEEPLHNWAAHGADAFMGIAQALKVHSFDEDHPKGILYNRVNKSSL